MEIKVKEVVRESNKLKLKITLDGGLSVVNVKDLLSYIEAYDPDHRCNRTKGYHDVDEFYLDDSEKEIKKEIDDTTVENKIKLEILKDYCDRFENRALSKRGFINLVVAVVRE